MRRGERGTPNKPMVPTAPATTEERSHGSVRQHIGESLDPRATKRRVITEYTQEQNLGQRTTNNGLRTTNDG